MTQANGMTLQEFTTRAITRLRKPPHKGIHTVYQGLNEAIREFFGVEPVPALQELVDQGKFVVKPTRGGVLIYLPQDAPAARNKAAEVIKAVTGK